MSVVTVGIILVCMLLAVVVTLAAASVRILREYQRAVVFRLGRLLGEKGPGLILLIPAVDRMVRVDLRTVTLDIPPQNLITRDNVPAKVNAVCYFRVIDAARAVVEVERYLQATSQIAQTTLRSVLGKADLDMLLSEREQLNEALQHIIDEHTDPWGIKVTTVEIKHVEIPGEMQQAMALGAQAERERRAKVIHAEGEFQASRRLRNAADVISGNPASLQLRYLQTLTEIGGAHNSSVIIPLPLDVMKPFVDAAAAAAASTALPDAGPRVELPDGALTGELPPRSSGAADAAARVSASRGAAR
jgi:regulator of protease activity HflC (stomatin/prohibitin superfamily)